MNADNVGHLDPARFGRVSAPGFEDSPADFFQYPTDGQIPFDDLCT
jgi:hypothetical protein